MKANSPDDYNDIGNENRVVPEDKIFPVKEGKITLPAHSLCIIEI